MARGEMRLAFWMLAPTFAVVFAVVLFPLLANFWISFKPIELADLRAPAPIASERLRGTLATVGDRARIEYRLRNSSQKTGIHDVRLRDELPPGYVVAGLDERCTLDGRSLECRLGDWPARHRERLRLAVEASENFDLAAPGPRASRPVVTGDATNVLTSLEFPGREASRP